MIVKTRKVIGLAGLALTACVGLVIAQEPAKKPAPSAAKAEAKAAKDPFAVPTNAKPEELMKFIEGLMQMEVEVETREEKIAHFLKVAAAIREAAQKVVDTPDVKERVALEALESLFGALEIQQGLELKGAAKAELDVAKKYSTDPRKKLAKMASQKLMFARLKNIKDLQADEQEKLVDDAVAYVKGSGKLTEDSMSEAMNIGQTLEMVELESLAATAYEKFAALFSASDDEDLASAGKKLLGVARRLRLVGKPIELEGTLVNGKPFDWAAYKGKVVLVDFWATWCGPCVGEMPNVKQNYLAYQSKGFDVVGISLDEDKEELEEFLKKRRIPWANLFSEDEDASGWEHPLASKYGVQGIPFTVLVGKDGNVIKMNVRGEELGEALAELLGPPDEAALKAALEAEEKARKADKKAAAAKEEAEEKDEKDEKDE